jgi:hypothetical protein
VKLCRGQHVARDKVLSALSLDGFVMGGTFYIYPTKVPKNIPVNSSLSMQLSQEIYSVRKFYPQVFVAQNNPSVLLNLLCTKPSFYSCFVTYESIPGNKTRLLSWNICSFYSHIFFDFLWSMWIFVHISSLVLILQLMVPRLIWRNAWNLFFLEHSSPDFTGTYPI